MANIYYKYPQYEPEIIGTFSVDSSPIGDIYDLTDDIISHVYVDWLATLPDGINFVGDPNFTPSSAYNNSIYLVWYFTNSPYSKKDNYWYIEIGQFEKHPGYIYGDLDGTISWDSGYHCVANYGVNIELLTGISHNYNLFSSPFCVGVNKINNQLQIITDNSFDSSTYSTSCQAGLFYDNNKNIIGLGYYITYLNTSLLNMFSSSMSSNFLPDHLQILNRYWFNNSYNISCPPLDMNIYHSVKSSDYTQLTATEFNAAPREHTHNNLASLEQYVDAAGVGPIIEYGGIGHSFTHEGLIKTKQQSYEPLTTHTGVYYSDGSVTGTDILSHSSKFGVLPYEYGGTTVTTANNFKHAVGSRWGQTTQDSWNPIPTSSAGYGTVIVPGEVSSNGKGVYFSIPVPHELETNVIFPTNTTTYGAALGIQQMNCWKSDKSGGFSVYSGISQASGLPKMILSSSGNIVIPTQAFTPTGTSRPVGTTVGTWSSAIEHGYLKYYLSFTNKLGTTNAVTPATAVLGNSICSVECNYVKYNNTYTE